MNTNINNTFTYTQVLSVPQPQRFVSASILHSITGNRLSTSPGNDGKTEIASDNSLVPNAYLTSNHKSFSSDSLSHHDSSSIMANDLANDNESFYSEKCGLGETDHHRLFPPTGLFSSSHSSSHVSANSFYRDSSTNSSLRHEIVRPASTPATLMSDISFKNNSFPARNEYLYGQVTGHPSGDVEMYSKQLYPESQFSQPNKGFIYI